MQDISGFGLRLQIIASNSFPVVGFPVTQFADDADPFDLPTMQIADKTMGANGDLIVWSKANPVIANVSVIPGSEDDINLSVLFENNRVGRGKNGTRDVITLVAIYPDGRTFNASPGKITDGMPGNGVASTGRQKSKTYSFAFENLVRTV